GPGRHQTAVTKTTGAVDHSDFHIACQAVMLQAVVAQKDIGAIPRFGIEGSARTYGIDDNRTFPVQREQQGFVAALFHRGAEFDVERITIAIAAITTAEDHYLHSAPL